MITIMLDRVDKRNYATFKNIPAMRESVNKHIKTIQESDLSDLWKRKLIRLLDHLRDLSRNFPGLSFQSQRAAAKDLGLKKPDTVGIWLKKLADMDIVKILPTKRYYKNQQTVNFVQIVPVETETAELNEDENNKRGLDEIPKPHKDADAENKNGEHEFKISLNSKTNINITYRRLDDSFTPKVVPDEFVKTTKPFFSDAEDIYDLWKKAALVYRQFDLLHELKQYTDIVIDALKQTIYAHKHRKIRKDFKGYFYGTLLKMFTYQKRQETFASHPSIFNWLENQEEESAGSTQNWRVEIQELMAKEERDLDYLIEEIPY
ncbi:hypothetical protein L2D08_23415 [Domibacillus sp. PGB-M46]|jgi:hypothetical protein|uniref:hypothetical protein n=1 Tax=Domibacillus sp. PGB-M46 TaxID=2910255 RepID=UPI001F59FA86|nr:hypothetical protein [Domibacillus sp. PGB-M46]MCI2257264.1 hypothetical protein [Domibacillus sp. PGB-M46]